MEILEYLALNVGQAVVDNRSAYDFLGSEERIFLLASVVLYGYLNDVGEGL